MGSPSMTISGSFDALSDEPPRMRMVELLPGAPSLLITLTPATLPASMSCALVVMPLLSSSGLMALTEPVASSFFTVP